MMELQTIWQQFTTLPPDAQRSVADFIAFLKQRYQPSPPPEPPPATDWRSDPFIGLWQDREDLQDSSQWVRATRSDEWHS